MKILQIFGAVVAVHLLAFIFIFASPGCQSGPGTVPTPDATVPTAVEAPAPVSFAPVMPSSPPVDLSAPSYAASPSGHAAPTRPGSAAAVAVEPETKAAVEVAPVSTYIVGRGDSLWSIAKKNHLTVAELAKANNLGTGSTLQPGRKLFIPGKPGVMPAQAKDVASAPAAAGEATAPAAGKGSMDSVKHTVQVGESLGIIARKYQVSVGELATANNITDPSKVRAGQQLIIPGFKTVTTKNTAAAAATTKAAKSTAKTAPGEKTATAATPPPPAAPKFEIMAPPPGQDLDSGLKDTSTEVPTVKVEDGSEPKK